MKTWCHIRHTMPAHAQSNIIAEDFVFTIYFAYFWSCVCFENALNMTNSIICLLTISLMSSLPSATKYCLAASQYIAMKIDTWFT